MRKSIRFFFFASICLFSSRVSAHQIFDHYCVLKLSTYAEFSPSADPLLERLRRELFVLRRRHLSPSGQTAKLGDSRYFSALFAQMRQLILLAQNHEIAYRNAHGLRRSVFDLGELEKELLVVSSPARRRDMYYAQVFPIINNLVRSIVEDPFRLGGSRTIATPGLDRAEERMKEFFGRGFLPVPILSARPLPKIVILEFLFAKAVFTQVVPREKFDLSPVNFLGHDYAHLWIVAASEYRMPVGNGTSAIFDPEPYIHPPGLARWRKFLNRVNALADRTLSKLVVDILFEFCFEGVVPEDERGPILIFHPAGLATFLATNPIGQNMENDLFKRLGLSGKISKDRFRTAIQWLKSELPQYKKGAK